MLKKKKIDSAFIRVGMVEASVVDTDPMVVTLIFEEEILNLCSMFWQY